MKQSELFTGHGGGTRQLHQKYGAEIRIDRYVIVMWSYPDVSSVNANKTINANDNFAPQDYALAA